MVLSPFQVVGDADDTYDATNTNSVTGTNTSLNRTPLDARVFNRTMMDELGVIDVAFMLSDIGGLGMPIQSAGSEDQRGLQEGDAVDYKSMSSRGLLISNPRRDGFLRSETSMMDSFDVESAEALQGSNSLLFGSGDAGGVVNINSKRARLRQHSLRVAATTDSEGSTRFTTDINTGSKWVGLRVNGVRSDEHYYRPILSMKQDGIQTALTIKPVRWLGIYADYRHFVRDHVRANSVTVRAAAGLRLSTGEALDNQSSRYLVGYGGSALLNDCITLTNSDSATGVLSRYYNTNEAKTVTVELTPRKDLAFQFRYGHDVRANYNIAPSNTIIFHPDAPGNLYRDTNGNLLRQWALNASMNPLPLDSGARGFKGTAVYSSSLGRWGDHRLAAFCSQQESWFAQTIMRFYEMDANGSVIQNRSAIQNSESGRNAMPAAWIPAFATHQFGGMKWPADYVVHPGNGKSYRLQPQVYAGAVEPATGNPLGLSGPVNATTGQTTNGSTWDDTNEKSFGFISFSSFWQGRIDTMAGLRLERADTVRKATGVAKGPIDYDSLTAGLVTDTPVRGVRIYGNYATNAKISFGSDTDIFSNLLPIGKGVSREVGLKFSLADHRLSGNISYYLTEARNFAGALGGTRDDVDPAGINGRNGGNGYTFSKVSNGLSAALSVRPLAWWQATFNLTQANGSERSDVSLPIFYNDQFNTMTYEGQSVVAIKNGGNNTLVPLFVARDPAVQLSGQVPLSIAMMKDPTSPYFATLDPDAGQILNAQMLGLLTPGVGTTRTGLSISEHQLGFVPPVAKVIVRRAGEKTTGYAENAFSLVNRFQIREGKFRGLVLGLTSSYQLGVRGYSYTDAADGGNRKVFYYPDRLLNNAFAVYNFKIAKRLRATVQANVSNVFDRQAVVALPRSTNGTIRYFAYQYSPRKLSLTTTLAF